MCGRYASSANPDDLASYFTVEEPPEEVLPPSYNVAPTDPVYVVMERHDKRQLRVVRWGLVPSWAKDPKVGARFINARRETVAEKPAFRAAYQRRRCLVPADGYYEWASTPGPAGPRKQPWFLVARDRSPLAMAGLYEVWRAPDETLLWTCTILTTDAPDELGQIHDRTPLLVPPGEWARWLDPAIEDPGPDLLVAGTPGVLDAWPVSPEVGNVRNNSPDLVEPYETGEPVPDEGRLF
jgi:putative SOS response-associated peptidase YedK